MSSEFLPVTSQYSVRAKNLWLDRIALYIKFKETYKLADISIKLLRLWIFSSLRMKECRVESVIYNYIQTDTTFEN